MIKVTITKKGRFPANTKKIKEAAIKTLTKNGIVSDADVDIAIVGKQKMDELNEKYYKDEVFEHPVFTFPNNESGDFDFPPDGKLHLGQIIISYPMAVTAARE